MAPVQSNGTSGNRYVVVSCDSHAGAPWADYRPYMEKRHLKAFDEWLATMRSQPALVGGTRVDIRGKQITEAFEHEEAVQAGGISGAWDPAVRRREMDREGVAGEIVFPDGIYQNAPPFNAYTFTDPAQCAYPYALRMAGARAYNRWLAALCDADPGRRAGIAILPVDDVAAMVKEARWARKAGLFGGILLQPISMTTVDPQYLWHHPRFDPLWAVCEELAMPVNIHSNGSGVNYGEHTGSRWIHTTEAYWTSRRPLWHLLWSGVLERHPKLTVMMAEVNGGWLPYELQLWEYLYDARNPELVRRHLPRRPTEYWTRQCYIGASPPSGRLEVETRNVIGINNFLWGSDYPHPDGAWPHSARRIREMFAGVPAAETRKMLGENAARVFGFDVAALREAAHRIGPRPGDILKEPPERGLPYKFAFINGVNKEVPAPRTSRR